MAIRKVLMIASTAERGPLVPLSSTLTSVDVEGGDPSDVVVVENIAPNLIQAVRLNGSNPVSVYANCEY